MVWIVRFEVQMVSRRLRDIAYDRCIVFVEDFKGCPIRIPKIGSVSEDVGKAIRTSEASP
jgi:hypothetical protein